MEKNNDRRKAKAAVPIKLAPFPRTKFAPAQEPLTDAAIKRTTEFDYVLSSDSSKKGKIVAQIPANWLVLPRPYDDSDIRTRLTAFLAAHEIPHDGEWREVQVRYTAPAGARSTRHWRLFVVRVTDHVSEFSQNSLVRLLDRGSIGRHVMLRRMSLLGKYQIPTF